MNVVILFQCLLSLPQDCRDAAACESAAESVTDVRGLLSQKLFVYS